MVTGASCKHPLHDRALAQTSGDELPLARTGAYLYFARNFLTPATPSTPPPTPTPFCSSREPSTVFPHSTTLSASFNPPLLREVAAAVGLEARAWRNAWVANGSNYANPFPSLTCFAPQINIVRVRSQSLCPREKHALTHSIMCTPPEPNPSRTLVGGERRKPSERTPRSHRRWWARTLTGCRVVMGAQTVDTCWRPR